MSIWHRPTTLDELKLAASNRGLASYLGITFIEIGDDFLRARMPVDEHTRQPYGILHGGASVALAETLGSVAAWLTLDPSKKLAVGLEINANHIRAVKAPSAVIGNARPLHVGSSTQVWDIRITTEDDKLVCISRFTVAVLNV